MAHAQNRVKECHVYDTGPKTPIC